MKPGPHLAMRLRCMSRYSFAPYRVQVVPFRDRPYASETNGHGALVLQNDPPAPRDKRGAVLCRWDPLAPGETRCCAKLRDHPMRWRRQICRRRHRSDASLYASFQRRWKFGACTLADAAGQKPQGRNTYQLQAREAAVACYCRQMGHVALEKASLYQRSGRKGEARRKS